MKITFCIWVICLFLIGGIGCYIDSLRVKPIDTANHAADGIKATAAKLHHSGWEE